MTESRNRKVWVLLSSFATYMQALNRTLYVYARQERKWQISHKNVEDVVGRTVDPGVIGIIGGFDRAETADWARGLGVPCVNVSSNREDPGLPSVWPDNPGIGRAAAATLSGLGLQHFGYFGFSDAWFSLERQRAFKDALANQGLPCAGRSMASSRFKVGGPLPRGVRRWLHSLERPCGLLAVTDTAAMLLMREVEAIGFRVPDDFAVLGVGDDDAVCPFCRPTLSSIPLPGQAMGLAASRLLLRLIKGQPAPAAPMRIPPPAPILRGSTQIDAPGDAILATAMRCIRQEAPTKMMTAGELASRCGVTRRTLDRHFITRLKMTPKQAIDQARSDHLKWMLVETDAMVKQLWADMDFSSANHMSRFFRRLHGISPSAYR